MREYKFRVWDGKTMVGVGSIEFFTDDSIHVNEELLNPDLMQYTGLKDKNGVEIYEYDLVKFVSGGKEHIKIVVWCKVRCCFVTSNSKNNVSACTSLYASRIYKHNLEVIGNIYQNPELPKQP